MLKGIAVLRDSFDDDYLGRYGPVVGLDHRGAARPPSIGVSGHAGRGRWLVKCKDLGVERAAGHQGHGRLLGGARAGLGNSGELGEDGHQRIRLLDAAAIRNWLGTNGCDTGFECPHQQPVP